MATKPKAETAGDVIVAMDKERERNLRIWSKVCRTDPRHTKKVNQRGGFTAIDAQYQIQRATEVFGPVGEGWGYDVGNFQIVGALIIVPVTMWHGNRENTFGPILGCCEIAGQRPDRDAPKKAITDAITKGLSQLGFNADVFLGLFDDNKYVADLAKEFAANDPVAEPKPGARRLSDMSDTALKGAVKAIVHHLNGCASVADLDDYLSEADTVAAMEQCKRRFPNWWETGAGMPQEFKPLKKIIEETRAGLAALEDDQQQEYAAAVIGEERNNR
jgi:hypothetical protein